MNGKSVAPARLVLSILGVLVTIAFPPAAHGQAPGPGGIPMPTPVVPTLPVGAGEIGLTIILLMLAAIAAAGVWAELSRMKEEREARRAAHPEVPTPADSHVRAPAGNPPPHRPEGAVPPPRHSFPRQKRGAGTGTGTGTRTMGQRTSGA